MFSFITFFFGEAVDSFSPQWSSTFSKLLTYFASNAAPDTPPVSETILSVKEDLIFLTGFISAAGSSPDKSPSVAEVVLSVVGVDASLTAVAAGGAYTLFAADNCGDTICVKNNLLDPIR